MRGVRCWCGELVVADEDEALVREVAEHIEAEHPDEPRSTEEIRVRIEQEAEEPPDRPPWAY